MLDEKESSYSDANYKLILRVNCDLRGILGVYRHFLRLLPGQ